jgi:hypothetical protein
MPTPSDIARVVTKVVKSEILSVLQALHTKIQELEARVASQQLQIDQLLSQNEPVLVLPTIPLEKNDGDQLRDDCNSASGDGQAQHEAGCR